MPRSLISNLTRSEQRKLLDDLNYLNTSEIKRFCKKHSIPYAISFETPDGRRRCAGADDRRGVMLGRVRHFLTTGAVPPGPASLLRSFASILAANLLQPTIDCIRAIRQ